MILTDEPGARSEMFSMLSSAATWKRGDSFSGVLPGLPDLVPGVESQRARHCDDMKMYNTACVEQGHV